MRDTCNEVVLFDLDGTLADTSHRYHLAPTVDPSSSWAIYAQACFDDTPIDAVVEALRLHQRYYLIHIVSGRDGSAQEQTLAWLQKHNIPFDRLTMRAPGNEDSNADVKVKYAQSLKAEGLDPRVLYDDWQDSVDAMKASGFKAIQVGNMRRLEPDAGNVFSGVI